MYTDLDLLTEQFIFGYTQYRNITNLKKGGKIIIMGGRFLKNRL